MSERMFAKLREIARRSGDRPALWTANGVVTYGRLFEQSRALAQTLRVHGVVPRDRVAIVLDNSAEFVLAYLGSLGAGAVVVPCNPGAPCASLASVFQDCRPVAAFMMKPDLATTQALRVADPDLNTLYAAHSGKSEKQGPLTIWSLADWFSSANATLPGEEAEEESLAAIIYTSGTTGTPKGVMLSHANLDATASAGRQMLDLRADDRVGIVAPLFHLYGLREVDAALRVGATVILPPGGAFLASVHRHLQVAHVTGISAVPGALALLVERYRSELAASSGHLRYLTIGTAPASAALLSALRETLPSTRIVVTYGLTEVSRVSFRDVMDGESSVGNVGRPYPGVEISLLGDSEGVGRVVVRSRMVMLGYWNRPEATRDVLGADGSLLTPDCGWIGADQTLHLLGRIDEVINCGGQKVSPAEVEEVLARHSRVAAVAVLAMADPAGILGQVVRAIVVRRDDSLSINELLRHAASSLEAHKVPRSIEFVNEIPRSVLGKPQRFQMDRSTFTRPE